MGNGLHNKSGVISSQKWYSEYYEYISETLNGINKHHQNCHKDQLWICDGATYNQAYEYLDSGMYLATLESGGIPFYI
jgi:hypothetical protein